MTRSLRIVLLAGGLAALAGLTLWLRSGTEPALPDPPPGTPVAPSPGAPARMVGSSAIGHGGPTAPPAAGPAAAMPSAGFTARKGTE